MTRSTQVDYIIVGQGLAGSAVALQLLALGKKIVVINQPAKNIASAVAAGLFNPVTGKKLVKTWLADTLFPYLHQFYQQAEALTNSRFFYPMPLYRPFISIEEQNEWMGRSSDANYLPYIDHIHTQPAFEHINNPFGGLLLKQCGYLDTVGYMNAVHQYIEQQAHWCNEDFDFEKLNVTDKGVTYKKFDSAKIIFCTGTHTNSLFDWVPIKQTKGETLNIKASDPVSGATILNRGVYLLPLQQGEWKVGATYQYNFQHGDEGITETARIELQEKVNGIVDFPYTVLQQHWGVRPTTIDRRPILGAHPTLKSIFIFNGLGTKGVSLAPYFSKVLVELTENDVPVNKEVDVERYKSLYSNSSL